MQVTAGSPNRKGFQSLPGRFSSKEYLRLNIPQQPVPISYKEKELSLDFHATQSSLKFV